MIQEGQVEATIKENSMSEYMSMTYKPRVDALLLKIVQNSSYLSKLK